VPYLTSQTNKAMPPLTFEQIDALLKFIEFHTDTLDDDQFNSDHLDELVGTDVQELYNILTEMRDAA
jgi:hypothetical protein